MQLFHKAINRRGTHSIKWDTYKNEELIHAWIADMDFEVPKPIQTALKQRIEHPIFGYTLPPENIGNIICNWTKQQYDWDIQKNGLAPESFQLTSIQALKTPSPIYSIFRNGQTTDSIETETK